MDDEACRTAGGYAEPGVDGATGRYAQKQGQVGSTTPSRRNPAELEEIRATLPRGVPGNRGNVTREGPAAGARSRGQGRQPGGVFPTDHRPGGPVRLQGRNGEPCLPEVEPLHA